MSVAYPLRLFLDCSTAHLSPIARTYLDAGDGIASTTSYGWFVYASEEPDDAVPADLAFIMAHARSDEHTSELMSLMRLAYAVFCLKNNTTHTIPKLPSTDN